MEKKHKRAIDIAGSDRQTQNTFSAHHSSSKPKVSTQELLQLVRMLPDNWALVAVGDNKAPLGDNWQKIPLTKQDFEKAYQIGRFDQLVITPKDKGKPSFSVPLSWWQAIGVLCGVQSGGLLFVDRDGKSCDALTESLSGCPVVEALPKTPTVTSGRTGRYQAIYRVPEKYWEAIATKKIKTGKLGDDGKPEQLELRWNQCQSIVAGFHPLTGSYYWIPEQAPWECEVTEVPMWIIEQMLKNIPSHQPAQAKANNSRPAASTWTDRERALSYLDAIPPTEDYDTWLHVGMALHSVGEDLLPDWDNWSRGATNYELGACESKWRSFKFKGIDLGTLGYLAKQNGWQSPFKENRSDRPTLTVIQGSSSAQSVSSFLEEADADFEELAQEVQSLVKLTEEPAPIQNLLSPRLTTPLMHRAEQFNVPLESFVGLLLPVAASLLKVGTQLEINSASNHRCPPIIWTGLVGESGANKSPIFDSIIRPLEGLQAQADEIYQLEFEQYEDELEDWQKRPKEERNNKPTPPAQREYYLQDVTMEAIGACLSTQPDRGVVIPIDEFAGFFNGFNQYRSGGRGSDRQKFLSAYNGGAIKVNRKSGNRVSLARTSISLTGTIQPSVLRKLMSDLDEVDGFWARFLWVPLPLTEMPAPSEGGNYDLSGLLHSLYQKLESLAPEIYRFDSKGQAIWRDWHIFCERHKVSESNPSLRAIYPKSKERAARIALVAHCINAIIEDQEPAPIIPSELLESAIAFIKWSIGQTRLIYAAAGTVSYEETSKIVAFIDRFKGHGWITARNVTHWWSPKPKPKAEAARKFMKQVADLGYAIDNGKTGKAYAIRIKETTDNSGNNSPHLPEPSRFESGNKSGNTSVTIDHNNPETLAGRIFEIGNSPNSSFDEAIVATEQQLYGDSSASIVGEASATLLPEVTSFVADSNTAAGKASTEICYPVIGNKLQVGDRVILTGEGNSRSRAEISAIWTVKIVQEQKAIVECETLDCRVFPLSWLALYERATK